VKRALLNAAEPHALHTSLKIIVSCPHLRLADDAGQGGVAGRAL
jgi:hypothetical protein